MKRISSLLVILMFSGCAFGTRHPVLNYASVVPKAEPNNIKVFVKPFVDNRTEQNVIGNVRNGWGMKTADVVTTTNVSEWVTNALRTELGNKGYVVMNEAVPIVTEGEVLSLYCDSYLNYEGKIMLGVVLKKDGQVFLDKKYTGTASDLNWAATANGYSKNLERSLQQAMIQIVNDINVKLASQEAGQ